MPARMRTQKTDIDSDHARKAAARFDDWATTYGEDRISPWFRYYQTLALSKLDLSGGAGFLDVGCGPGWAVREAARQLRDGKACGIDISPGMIEKAKSHCEGSLNVEFRVANSEQIPYADESFHSVLCSFSFHHYENPLTALAEIKRVLKTGGKIVILDSARDVSFPMWLQDRWRRHFERSHVRYYTTKELGALIEQVPLKILGDVVTVRKTLFKRKLFTALMLFQCTK